MKTLALFAVALSLWRHPLRLGRDLIFDSDDVAEFTLPNGEPARTNRWYDQDQLLAGDQEFYLSGHRLGSIDPEAEGLAVAAQGGEARGCPAVAEELR